MTRGARARGAGNWATVALSKEADTDRRRTLRKHRALEEDARTESFDEDDDEKAPPGWARPER